ncbi:histidine kinase [Alicyclobacillaceae bacterium I2511]|nr:histidine kinase [Alicyclobacillaceae bacterium I2511]
MSNNPNISLDDREYASGGGRVRPGKLKLFIGAAPGVGKTYTMLQEARSLRERGLDVVVGYIDVHHRSETEGQIDGLEVLARKSIVYKDRNFEELDVAGVLSRNPQVVVIDELAHTNIPGSQRAKRYMDVEYILDQGIDVLTAVNVQHLESARDEAQTVIGVKVREVIPDSFVRRAGEVEVIDVTPETLRQRLRDGSIYPREKVSQALQHFFRKSNLSALRELALREVADDVDERLQQSYERRRIPGPVGAKENILVCVNYVERAYKLVEKAERMADRMKAGLIVFTVLKLPVDQLTNKEKETLQRLQKVADEFDAQFIVEVENDRKLGEVIMAAAEQCNVTQIVLGQPARGHKWSHAVSGNPVRYLLRHMKYIDLRVVGWKD